MDKPAKDRPKTGMAYLDLTTGKMEAFESVEEFAFSDDGRWLAIGFFRPEEKPAPAGPTSEGEAKKEAPPAWDAGRPVLLRNLESGEEFKLEDVLSFSFDPKSTVLAVVLSAADGRKNGLAVRDLKRSGIPETVLYLKEKASFAAPVWAKDSTKMALTAAVKKNKEDPGRASLVLWEYVFGSDSADEAASAAPAGWILPLKSPLEWSADGKRLYLGLRPEPSSETRRPGRGGRRSGRGRFLRYPRDLGKAGRRCLARKRSPDHSPSEKRVGAEQGPDVHGRLLSGQKTDRSPGLARHAGVPDPR